MSEITKEEIAIMIEVQSKTVINLEKIATSLKDIVEEQKALTVSQTKLKDELQTGSVKIKLDAIHNCTNFNKNLFSTMAIVILVVGVMLKFITF